MRRHICKVTKFQVMSDAAHVCMLGFKMRNWYHSLSYDMYHNEIGRGFSMCVCVYVCIYIYICIYMCVYVCIYICIYVYIDVAYSPHSSIKV
jgi:hypothetical protein